MTTEPKAPTYQVAEADKDSLAMLDSGLVHALAELGSAHLRHSRAKTILEQVQHDLVLAERKAHSAEADKARVVAQVTTGLNLPPGEYQYDSEDGSFKLKE